MSAGVTELINQGKDQMVDMIVRPPRASYSISHLGPSEFMLGQRRFQRTDFQITNRRGLRLECSHYEPVPEERPRAKLPCVIYAHGNCGCRLDSQPAIRLVLPYDMTLFSFDFSGCGKSEGEYISLGYFEQEDLAAIVAHLKASDRVSQIGIWGRSMGAVTALLYASNDKPPGTVQCIVADSAFTSLSGLARELVEQSGVSVPGMLLSVAIRVVRSSIQSKAGFDIDKLSPVKKVKKARTPVLFAHGESDNFISPKHSRELIAKYGGTVKNLITVDGDHNSPRPRFFNDSVSIFLNNHLLVGPDAFNQESFDRAGGGDVEAPWVPGGGGMGGYDFPGMPSMSSSAFGSLGEFGDFGGGGMGGGGFDDEEAMLQQVLAASMAAPPPSISTHTPTGGLGAVGGGFDDEEEFMRQQLEQIALMEANSHNDLPPDYDPSLFE